jgi:SMI1 / KNR4 family (SUKH-1)
LKKAAPIQTTIHQIKAAAAAWRSEDDLAYDGGVSIRRCPWIAPVAYLHTFNPPLPSEGIEQLEQELGWKLPAEYRALLHLHNGIHLFNLTISIYGLRTSYKRTDLDAAMWQPFNLLSHQRRWQESHNPYDLVIGSMGGENDKIVMRAESADVARYLAGTDELVETWATLHDFLTAEVARLSSYYDDLGKLQSNFDVPAGKVVPREQINLSEIKAKFGTRAWWWDFKDKFRNSAK